jgi:hypothetical protein
MRKIDKKHNMSKVNLLAEQRYLQSKGLLIESSYMPNGMTTGLDDIKTVNEDPIGGNNELMVIKRQIEDLKPNFTINFGALKVMGLDLEIAYDLNSKFYKVRNSITGKYYVNNILHTQCVDCEFRTPDEVIKFIRLKAEGGAVKFMPQQNEGVEEGDLGAYRSNLQNTGNYPWTTYLGNKEKGESDEKQNIKDKEGFENEFKKSYAGQTIETTNGLYTFFDIKYKNNYGNYDLIFTKPKGENDWSDANLFITYDQTLGYYIDEYKGIKLTDADSEEKVIEMLSYNK